MGAPRLNLPEYMLETHSPEQTGALGSVLAEHCHEGDLLALIGELGAGKTQLVRGLAQGLKVHQGPIASPTFVLVHEYLPREPGTASPRLVHIDAYRLSSVEDLETIGWDISQSRNPGGELRQGAVVAIEWADRLGGFLGEDVLTLRLSHVSETQRQITFTASGNWAQRLPRLWPALQRAVATPSRPCPICSKSVPATAATFPFCSSRCRMADLGKWMMGDYRLSRPLEPGEPGPDEPRP